MATRTTRGAIPDVEDEPLSQEEFELARFLEDESGNIAQVLIFRKTPKGELDHVATTTVDGMSEDTLREMYGAPAVYVLKFKNSKNKFIATKHIRLGATKLGAPDPGSGVAAPASVGPLMDLQIQSMRESAQRSHEMMLALIASLANRQMPTMPDPASMMAAITNAFATVQGAAKPTAAAIDPFMQFKTMLDLVRDIVPGSKTESGSEDNIWSVVRDVGGRVVDAAAPFIQGALTQGTPGAPVVQRQPPAIPASTEVRVDTGGVQMTDEQKTFSDLIRAGLGYLKTKARVGKDALDYVDWVLDEAEEPQNAAMLHALKSGATFDQLLTFDPEIAQNPVLLLWFREFYRGLFDEIHGAGTSGIAPAAASKGDATDHSVRASGNNGDASGNAGAGDPGRVERSGANAGGENSDSGADRSVSS